VRDVIAARATEPVEDVAQAIQDRAREFAAGVLRDDVAIVVFRRD